eukprot:2716769-Prorocentrum_lima.AAC.1
MALFFDVFLLLAARFAGQGYGLARLLSPLALPWFFLSDGLPVFAAGNDDPHRHVLCTAGNDGPHRH